MIVSFYTARNFALITDNRGKTNYEFKTAFAPVHRQLTRSFRIAQSGTIDTGDIIAKTLEALEKEEAEQAAKEKGNEVKKADDPKGPDVPDTKKAEVKVAGDVLVDEIKIINGAVKLINQKTNGDSTINAINLTLNAPDRAKPILAKGALRYREQRISLNAEVNSLGHVLDGKEAATKVAMTSDQFEGQFKGNIGVKEGVRFSGTTDVQTYSLQKLLAWLGTDVPQKGYGASYVRGKLSGEGGLITLKDAKIKNRSDNAARFAQSQADKYSATH